MAKAAAVNKETMLNIDLPKPGLKQIKLTVVGESSLITHAWSAKAKRAMLDKQMKKAQSGKVAKDPWMDFCESLHWITPMPEYPTEEDIRTAKFGFPAVGFKSAAVDACSHIAGITKVLSRGAFHITGDQLIEIIYPGGPIMREDMVRIAMGTADIRYRAEFKTDEEKTWRATIPIQYNESVISPEQIANLFMTGGFAIGVGEWRPQRDGSFGRFRVE